MTATLEIKIETVTAQSMVRNVTGTINGKPFEAWRGRARGDGYAGNYEWNLRGKYADWDTETRRAFSRKMNIRSMKSEIQSKTIWA